MGSEPLKHHPSLHDFRPRKFEAELAHPNVTPSKYVLEKQRIQDSLSSEKFEGTGQDPLLPAAPSLCCFCKRVGAPRRALYTLDEEGHDAGVYLGTVWDKHRGGQHIPLGNEDRQRNKEVQVCFFTSPVCPRAQNVTVRVRGKLNAWCITCIACTR